MKVLHICSYYGSPLYALLLEALEQKGVEQKVFYFAVRGTEYKTGKQDVCFSCCYNNFDRAIFTHKEKKAIGALYRNIDVASFDVLHAHSLYSNGYIALDVKRRYGIPYIVAVRNTDVNEFLKSRPWLRRIGIEIMLEADIVVFLSPSYKRNVVERFVPSNLRAKIEQKCRIIPNGISEVFFDNVPTAPRIPDGVIRIVQVGDINKNKNQLALVKACRELEKKGNRVSYTVIGRACDKRIASKLEKCSFVKLLPPMSQSDLKQQYRTSDVFVMPSIHETFGLVYAEAMSQGLPVVYTKGQGFDGWLSDNRLGRAVGVNDAAEIADAVLKLLDDRNDEQFLALLSSAKRFRWSDIANIYLSIYNRLTNGND